MSLYAVAYILVFLMVVLPFSESKTIGFNCKILLEYINTFRVNLDIGCCVTNLSKSPSSTIGLPSSERPIYDWIESHHIKYLSNPNTNIPT